MMGKTGNRRRIGWLLGAVLLALFVCAAGEGAAAEVSGDSSEGYSITTPFFSDKHVMVIVPHQDDEVNLAGGIMEQYIRAGSEVTVVFATNGDYNGLAELRSREALAAAQTMGIPAENVIYLGYGNQWQHQQQEGTERKHIYFSADGDAVWTSHYGAEATYGTSVIDCYRTHPYTRNHYLYDLMAVILEKRPDVIYCGDYDAHHDHMALDLFFEEAMGMILAQEADYHPVIYKGLCYGTAWYAEPDFIGAENLLSSKFPAWENWERLGISYCWAERVRLPVSGGNLSRYLSQTELYQTLRSYRSQNGYRFSESVLNGDKVFWERRSDSLLYRAAFYDGAEQVTVWNDFKLKDSVDFSALVNTGLRYAQRITVELESPESMDAVWLYDNPSQADNILGGYLLFDDGSRVDFGPLEPGGAATKITFEQRTVGSFELCFTRTEGEAPALAEIEAYCGETGTQEPQLLMAVDEGDHFVYDHWIPSGNYAEFSLYAYPAGTLDGWEDVEITLEGEDGCGWSLEKGALRVVCPTGRQAAVTIRCENGVSTTFSVSNPGAMTRWITRTVQVVDRIWAFARDGMPAQPAA